VNTYFVITEVSHAVGWGHVSRQVAIALRAMQRGIRPTFISISPMAGKFCKEAHIPFVKLEDYSEVIDYLGNLQVSNLIIDVHEKNFPIFRPLLNEVQQMTLVVSEEGVPFTPFGHHVVRVGSDVQTWHYREFVKNEYGRTQVHAGRAWQLFRNEFQDSGLKTSREPGAILIAHGGSDPFQLTARSLRSLQLTKDIWDVYVMVTDSYSDISNIERIASLSKHRCQVIKNTTRVAAWMRRATVALINGGNVRYELCIAKTPFVTISFHAEQYNCNERLAALGVGVNLGLKDEISDGAIAMAVENLLLDHTSRRLMQLIMGRLFDLRGCDRILDLMEEPIC
jgi:spore coat polysaccharide biosynthesis predicted glycosyltransferase SpsG